MVRFLTMDIFLIAGSAASVLYYLQSRKKSKADRSKINAYFIGGPLDGKRKMVYPDQMYVYKDVEPPVIYKPDGFDCFIPLEKGES